ncbi:type II toxin-antitoxin system RelE/ParE family toxin [Sulfuricurvum sp.]|uniref:type II toxin-antitoxin system RelE/ParE family toxin n=1 Tax=Sulfuricurvum sp. TaxID=2025608 RepID=UPI00286DA45C|nr:type II toxin-antitoxin system RelE/ParE family toxin [Sulfuricurvum sp.]
MPYKILYLEHAYTDLETILDHIAEDSPSHAIEYLKFLKNSISKLSNFPYLGVTCKRKHIRRECRVLIIENYLVFYKTNESSKIIIIGRVLHRSVNYKTKKLF